MAPLLQHTNSAPLFMYPWINHLKLVGLGFATYKMDIVIPALLPSFVILRIK